jgi:hypothetical protein
LYLISRRRAIAFDVCIATAFVLHVCFVDSGGGFYRNGDPPPQAWFGQVGEVAPYELPQSSIELPSLYSAGFQVGELVGLAVGTVRDTCL